MSSYLPPSAIDFAALSHVIHFALIPDPDGTLDGSTNVVERSTATDQPPYRHGWDPAAAAPFISLDASGSSNDRFISYDDPTAVEGKVRYARAQGIGGGYRANQPEAQRDPLLQALKRALAAADASPTATATRNPTAASSPKPTATPTPTAPPTPTRTRRFWLLDGLTASPLEASPVRSDAASPR